MKKFLIAAAAVFSIGAMATGLEIFNAVHLKKGSKPIHEKIDSALNWR